MHWGTPLLLRFNDKGILLSRRSASNDNDSLLIPSISISRRVECSQFCTFATFCAGINMTTTLAIRFRAPISITLAEDTRGEIKLTETDKGTMIGVQPRRTMVTNSWHVCCCEAYCHKRPCYSSWGVSFHQELLSLGTGTRGGNFHALGESTGTLRGKGNQWRYWSVYVLSLSLVPPFLTGMFLTSGYSIAEKLSRRFMKNVDLFSISYKYRYTLL